MPRARAASFCCPRAVAVSRADAIVYRTAAVERETHREHVITYSTGRRFSRTETFEDDSHQLESEVGGSEGDEQSCAADRVAADRVAADLALFSRLPLAKRHCATRQQHKLEEDFRQTPLLCHDERRRFEQEKATYVQETKRRYEEERERLVAENAAHLKELENERMRLLHDTERQLEEERHRIHKEAESKLEAELSRIRAEAVTKRETSSRKISITRCQKKRQKHVDKQAKEVQILPHWHEQDLIDECQRLAQETERCKEEFEEQKRQVFQEAERRRQEIEEERKHVAQELEYARKSRDRMQDEQSRLAAEMQERQRVIEEKLREDHLREMANTKAEKARMLEEAKRIAESHMEKLKEEKAAFLEQRKAFEDEKARFLAEKKRLEAEFQKLQHAVTSQRQVLADVERRRIVEERSLADALKQQKALQTVASLATIDHSAAVDPSLTDIKERAMAKAASLSKHIGSVALQLLLDKGLGKLDAADATLFQKQLASGELLDVESTIICTPEPGNYGQRGGKPYFKPAGWIRCGLSSVPSECEDWCIAYHGTTDCNALRIMLHGLKRPGEGGVQVAHGQVHSDTGSSIYVSPSIEYAAFPCYSQIFKLGDEHWAQLVLECRVRPGSFKQASGTLSSNKHWPSDVPIDENFPGLADLEWLLERNDDVVISALMIREFGQQADESIYGTLVARVKSPEYIWTELRAEQARANSLRVGRGDAVTRRSLAKDLGLL